MEKVYKFYFTEKQLQLLADTMERERDLLEDSNNDELQQEYSILLGQFDNALKNQCYIENF